MKKTFFYFVIGILFANQLFGQSIITNYDVLGRVTKIIYPDSSIIIYSYDNIGNRLTIKVKAPPTKILNVKVFLEGLYAGNGIMNQAMAESKPQFGSGIADSIRMELHNIISPYKIAYSHGNAEIHTNGTLAIKTIPANLTNSYYLVIKHRNGIETWSGDVIDFSESKTLTYDFTTDASKAYGYNEKLMEGNVYAIYAGDASQDGIVDGSDMAKIDNASTGVLKGYYPEDVNGDGLVDGSDMAIIDNNSTAVVHIIRPW